MLLFFLRIHSLNILVNEGILENPCVLLGSKLFCSKFDQKSTPPLTEIFLVLCSLMGNLSCLILSCAVSIFVYINLLLIYAPFRLAKI